jgi:hypothetical protein
VKRARAVLLAALALAGCAGPQWVYEKRRATPAQLDHDLESCRRQAFRPQRFALWPSDRFDPTVLKHCMERKGYQVRRPDEGAAPTIR